MAAGFVVRNPATNLVLDLVNNVVSLTVIINSQSLEDMQIRYISQKYTLDDCTLEKYTAEMVQKCKSVTN